MLEAFIIDQLKKAEEKEWEQIVPTLEIPLDVEDEPCPPAKEKKVWIIDFN